MHHVITCYELVGQAFLGGILDRMTQQSTLAEKAYTALRNRLVSGSLPPGSRLVNRSLAADLGLSLTPVREAINRLASDGVVEFVSGRGAFVRKLSSQDIFKIYELRELLEPHAAAQAALNASQYQLEELRQICQEAEQIVDQLGGGTKVQVDHELVARMGQHEITFHQTLTQAANNHWLTQSIMSLRFIDQMYFAHQLMERAAVRTHNIADTVAEHTSLFAAVENRDNGAAEKLMRAHLTHGKREFLSLLQEQA
jgi:DNA-binding GntR family transcriptional regulator